MTFLAWALVVPVGGASAQSPDQTEASNLISNLADDTVKALTAKSLTSEQRTQSVREIIERYTNLQHISGELIGRAWVAASPEQKAKFQGSLIEYLAALCVGMVRDLPSETRVMVVGAEPRDGRMLVHSDVIIAPDDHTPVDWAVVMVDGRLALVDVSAEGVSLIRTMRSDFRSVLTANGGQIDALIAAMDRKVKLAAN